MLCRFISPLCALRGLLIVSALCSGACGGLLGAAEEVLPPSEVLLAGDAKTSTDAPGNAFQRIWKWSDARVRGVFDYVLPDTQERRTWKLSLQPRFRDMIDKDHVRLPVSVTYGLNRRTDIEVEVDPYFANPFNDGSGDGIANVRANLKYRWTPALDATVNAATGIEVERPFQSAPYRFNEGINRYRVYMTLARPSPSNPNLEGFLNLSYDLITPSSAEGEIDEDEPQNDFFRIGTGALYRRNRFTYGMAVAWAHTVDEHITNFVTLTPSVIYDVPRKWAFNSPGQWQIGASVEGKRYGAETDLNVRVRVRWQIDFKRMLRDWRSGASRETRSIER